MKLQAGILITYILIIIANCDHLSKLRDIEQNSHKFLTSATFEIVEACLIDYSDILNIIPASLSLNVSDFKDEFLARAFMTSNVVIRQELGSALAADEVRKRRNAIFILENFDDFCVIFKKLTSALFELNGSYLIILINGNISKIQDMFNLLWQKQVFNVAVLHKTDNKTIQVKTFIPFSPGNCHNSTPTLVDEFEDGKFIKGGKNLFPKKMKNLFNCTVRVSISNTTKPYVMVNDTTSLAPSGGDISLLNVLAESLNFQIDYAYIHTQGYLYDNGSSEGPLNALQYEKVDISISNWWLKPNRLHFFDYTESYLSDKIIFVIPRGEDLTSFEEFTFPFHRYTWLLISTCFIIGSLVIFIIKKQSKMVQSFVFGKGVKTPYTNLLIAFIGGSQKVLPKRNFARFLLMMFLMYSLVIRTVYQGWFYIVLQSNKYHQVQTIDEMIQKDFTLFVYKGHADMFEGTEAMAKQ